MMNHDQPAARAFTLVETILVVALSLVMMLALGLLIYNFNTISAYQQTSAQSFGSANALMSAIDSLVLPADAVVQTYTFPSATYTSSSTVLVLEIPSIDSSGNVIANTYDYAAFYVVGTNAYRTLQANTLSARISGTKKLSSTVRALTFTYNNTDFTQVNEVTVDIQTQASMRQNVLSDHLNAQMWLRNYQ